MWEWLLAQATGETIVTSGAFVGALMFIVKWFMKAVDDRNNVIKGLADDSNKALLEVSRAVQESTDRLRSVEHAIRAAPCGMRLEDRHDRCVAVTPDDKP